MVDWVHSRLESQRIKTAYLAKHYMHPPTLMGMFGLSLCCFTSVLPCYIYLYPFILSSFSFHTTSLVLTASFYHISGSPFIYTLLSHAAASPLLASTGSMPSFRPSALLASNSRASSSGLPRLAPPSSLGVSSSFSTPRVSASYLAPPSGGTSAAPSTPSSTPAVSSRLPVGDTMIVGEVCAILSLV